MSADLRSRLFVLTFFGASCFAGNGCVSTQREEPFHGPASAGSADEPDRYHQTTQTAIPATDSPGQFRLVQHAVMSAQEVVEPKAPAAPVNDAAPTPRKLTSAEPIMIDLPSALSMASRQNPQIALAAARYREAYARLDGAQKLWLPTIRAGVSYHHHDGNLQASDGTIVDVDRSSLQAGLGVQAVGAGTSPVPGVVAQFHTSDALFQPKIEAHAASASRAAISAATNDTLLATALGHLQLLRAAQQLRVAEQTHGIAVQLADLTDNFARSGQGSQADADRAQTERVRRRNEVSRAQEALRVAGARLAELLSLDPTVEIYPREATVIPVDLVSHDVPPTQLVATGLSNRPELAEAQFLVCEAVYRYRREKYAPLLPSVLLGISQGGFGGGLGSHVNDVRGRFDFDAAAFWELRNLGLGDRARAEEKRARYDQARARQVAVMDRIAREVIEASQQLQSRFQQIAVAQSGVQHASNSYERNLTRIREGQGLPIEVLQSIQALDEARREYLRTIVDYNDAQFRLQRSLGWPIREPGSTSTID